MHKEIVPLYILFTNIYTTSLQSGAFNVANSFLYYVTSGHAYLHCYINDTIQNNPLIILFLVDL